MAIRPRIKPIRSDGVSFILSHYQSHYQWHSEAGVIVLSVIAAFPEKSPHQEPRGHEHYCQGAYSKCQNHPERGRDKSELNFWVHSWILADPAAEMGAA
jgi:hypothetical protein